MSRSSNAARYGSLAERKAADRYRLRREGAHTSWCDAITEDGTPVEIKSTMVEHSDGQPGNFKLYRQYHERLVEESGRYVFVVYKPRGRGITVLKMEMRHSTRLPMLRWHGGGEHRNSKQGKLAIEDVFA